MVKNMLNQVKVVIDGLSFRVSRDMGRMVVETDVNQPMLVPMWKVTEEAEKRLDQAEEFEYPM